MCMLSDNLHIERKIVDKDSSFENKGLLPEGLIKLRVLRYFK